MNHNIYFYLYINIEKYTKDLILAKWVNFSKHF